MHVKTLLNSVEKHKGFVYDDIKLVLVGRWKQLHVKIRPRKRCKGLCSGCLTPGPTYDTLDERRFQFVPLWGMVVYFLYVMRRISCVKCERVVVEAVPWAKGKQRVTTSFAWFLARWAKRMSWKEVGVAFGVSWDTVFAAVKMAVAYGLEHRSLEGVTEIGVDEVMWRSGKRKFLTVVYQINEGFRRLLWIGKDRRKSTLEAFFKWFGRGRTKGLQAIASDMWEPYLRVIAKRVPWAINVLDRFHITANVNKAVDKVRAEEARALARKGTPVLKHTRWLLLKSPENLKREQRLSLKTLLKINLKTVRAYLLKEELRKLWSHFSLTLAGSFLLDWCRAAKASRIEPLARVARTLEKKRELVLNWFRGNAAISSGAVEGLNNKLKVIVRRAYGFRSYDVTSNALYHGMGHLPEPDFPHRFC
jgi:transposase